MKAKILEFTVVLTLMFLLFSFVAAASVLDTPKDKSIERIDFIHYVKPRNPASGPRTEVCYKLMGVSWSWNMPVRYVVNPNNTQGLTEAFITSVVLKSAEAWDSATPRELFNDTYTINYSVRYGVRDSQNSIVFGNYSNSNVIAITSVWLSKKTGQILEFDQLYNTRFLWGDVEVNSTLMDLQNIATHELGHAVGLNDLYGAGCSEVTMYGYSTQGETKKRTLASSDIAGLQKIYGV